ncbi:hypothetical protein V5N11_010380 [Cardamine amara subsp. amara]|uniref:Uncharacterized protein n=1 Tax=Cardamine amara subsp. amara TaxID=228776 RepID=A0ABD1A3X4_CARAN
MSGRQYYLWPVIIMPYNLLPGMCMEKEFLFLTILVPGPKHPKRSLDIFLQPSIHELKELWLDNLWEIILSVFPWKDKCISAKVRKENKLV